MMVTDMLRLGKGRYKLLLEGGDSFVLYKGEVRRLSIETGKEIPEELYREIMDEILVKRAINRLLFLLQSRDHTKAELREKLERGEYPEPVTEEALRIVEGYGYINDASYTKRYLECYNGRKSRGKIRMELMRKGISRELLETEMEEVPEDRDAEKELIRRLLMKRHYDPASADPKEKQKQYAYLRGKGFPSDEICQCL